MGMTGETLAGYVMRNAQNEIVRAPWCWTQADADLRTPGEVDRRQVLLKLADNKWPDVAPHRWTPVYVHFEGEKK